MTKEEIRQKAVDNAKRYEVWPPAADYQDGLIKGFEDCAEWMQENNEGKALLYAVEKTAERTKREVIDKAVKWMYNYFVIDHYGMSNAGFGLFEQIFKKAMQDESK